LRAPGNSEWIESRKEAPSLGMTSSCRKVSATQATDDARSVWGAGTVKVDDATLNVRWREWVENPTVDVRGLGHGTRTVADARVPEVKVKG